MSARLVSQTAQPVQAAPMAAGGLLQRQCACGQHSAGECSECARNKHVLARSSAGSRTSDPREIPSSVGDVLRAPGQPLDASTRSFFGSRFAHDFSRIRTYASTPVLSPRATSISSPEDASEREADRVAEQVLSHAPAEPAAAAGRHLEQVRIHTDARAAESARAVNACAYTVGRDIVFGEGQYQPRSSEGKRLLAHELAHVFQQSGAADRPGAAGSCRAEFSGRWSRR